MRMLRRLGGRIRRTMGVEGQSAWGKGMRGGSGDDENLG